jgi:hypothetical protein
MNQLNFIPIACQEFRHSILHPVSSSSKILTQNERKCRLPPSLWPTCLSLTLSGECLGLTAGDLVKTGFLDLKIRF